MNKNNSERIIVNRQRRNQQLALPVKSALRSLRRQDNDLSILVSGPNDPRAIKPTTVTKLVELSVTATSVQTITYNQIYKAIDALTVPYFDTMRVISMSAYGSAKDEELLTIRVSGGDDAIFTDRGVFCARRPAIHIRFNEKLRIEWTPVASGSQVVTVGTPSAEKVVLQFTIEVRSLQQ